jgi:hypothetical protein
MGPEPVFIAWVPLGATLLSEKPGFQGLCVRAAWTEAIIFLTPVHCMGLPPAAIYFISACPVSGTAMPPFYNPHTGPRVGPVLSPCVSELLSFQR